jgi:hypothetical protein
MRKMTKIQHIISRLFFTCLIVFSVGCKKDEVQYSLKTSIQPANSGTVDLSPSGANYAEGLEVTLSPKPAAGYQFDKWGGTDASLVSNNKIVMSKNMDIIANFSLSSYSISASVSPANSGTITGSGSFNYGQTVSLKAKSAVGYTFTNWTENGTQVSKDTVFSFTANANRTLVANFILSSYAISASVSPANSGTIAGTGSFNYGQNVSLTATAADGFKFTNWTENGTQVSTNSTYSFTANANRTLVANFNMKTLIRLKTGTGLNSGAHIYFVALSKNADYNNFTTEQLFAYKKTDADWYIDGDVVPFTTNYKEFGLDTGEYKLFVSASGTVMYSTVTVVSGKQTYSISGTTFGGIDFDVIKDSKSSMILEKKTRIIVNRKR